MSADDKAAAAWDDYIDQQQEEKIEQLERELNAATSEIERLTAKVAQLYDGAEKQKQLIKRLEEAGDGLMKSINCGCPYGPSVFNCQTCTNSWDAWRKAKEAKP